MIHLPETGAVLGRCGCGAVVRTDSFRDLASYAEFFFSGFDQPCQDRAFLGLDEQGKLPPCPIRFGALAAHLAPGPVAPELVVLPFLFVPEFHVLAWEARYILRIGPRHSDAPLMDLYPMGDSLAGHRVRVTEIDSYADPRLVDWFSDLELLIACNRRAIDAIVGACSPLGTGLRIALDDAVDWSDFATGVPPVDAPRPDGDPPVSPLHLCALLGAALALPERISRDEPRTAAWRVLESLRAHFPDSSAQSRT